MSRPNYKYSIHERLLRLSAEDYEIAMKFLPGAIGIANQTFRNWIYRSQDDGREIPANAILVLANFFQCEPQEIFSDHEQFSKPRFELQWENFKEKFQDQKKDRLPIIKF